MKLEFEGLFADQPLEGRDPGLVLLDRRGRSRIFVEGARLILLHPDPDQVAREVVAMGETVQRLTS